MSNSTQSSTLLTNPATHEDTTMATTPNETTSYSKVTQRTNGKTKEHATTMRAMDGLTITDYSLALGKLINPKNISHQSKTSGGRVCFYLTSKELVNKLTESNTTLKIKEHIVEIKPLVTRTKKILLSNIDPFVPASYIEGKFREFGVRPTSRIIEVKAGMTDPEYQHILCFRRIVYVLADDIRKLPSRIRVDYEDSNKMMYISEGQLKCFLCHEEGHRQKDCENNEAQSFATVHGQTLSTQREVEENLTSLSAPHTQSLERDTPDNEIEKEDNNSDKEDNSSLTPDTPNVHSDKRQVEVNIAEIPPEFMSQSPSSHLMGINDDTETMDDNVDIQKHVLGNKNSVDAKKRPLSISSGSSTTSNIPQKQSSLIEQPTKIPTSFEMNQATQKSKQRPSKTSSSNKKKKRKTSASRIKTGKDIKSTIVPAREHFLLNETKYPVTFDELVSFLEDSIGSSNIPELMKAYTSDTAAFAHMLEACLELVNDHNLKKYIAKIYLDITGENLEYDESEDQYDDE